MRICVVIAVCAAAGLAACGREPASNGAASNVDAPRPIATEDAGAEPGAEASSEPASRAEADNVSESVAAPDTPFVIVMIGDSLTGGHEIPPELALPEQLGPLLAHDAFDVELRNAGIANDTTATGRARLGALLTDDVDGVVIELGAVDMIAGLPVDAARANLAAMIEAAQARGLWVGLVGMRASLELDQSYQDAFNGLFEDLAYTYDVALYPFYFDGLIDPETGAARLELLQPDGVHPTEDGVAVVAEGMADWLADVLPDTAREAR